MSTVFCAACGTRNDGDSSYCMHCGRKLHVPDDAGDIRLEPDVPAETADASPTPPIELGEFGKSGDAVADPEPQAGTDDGDAGPAGPAMDQAVLDRIDAPVPYPADAAAAAVPRSSRRRRMLCLLAVVCAVAVIAATVWYFVFSPYGVLGAAGKDGIVAADPGFAPAPSTSDGAEPDDGESGGIGKATDAATIIEHVNEGRFDDLVGTYCRNNGACIAISRSTSVALVDRGDNTIDAASMTGMYPFSPYLEGITVDAAQRSDGVPDNPATVYLALSADPDESCPSGSENDMPSCTGPDGGYVFLNATMYYVPAGTPVDTMKAETHAITDDGDPDTSRPYLVFQMETGTNAPFDASDDAVFYLDH